MMELVLLRKIWFGLIVKYKFPRKWFSLTFTSSISKLNSSKSRFRYSWPTVRIFRISDINFKQQRDLNIKQKNNKQHPKLIFNSKLADFITITN